MSEAKHTLMPWVVGVSIDETRRPAWPVFRLRYMNDPQNVEEIETIRRLIEAAPKLLKACKEAKKLPEICEEIGYAGEHDRFHHGHAMIKTSEGKYVKAHTQGGYPEQNRILALLQEAIIEAEGSES